VSLGMVRNKRILRCPRCGFEFDISYGRVFACAGCPSSVHCDMAKCPECGHEFPIGGLSKAYSNLRIR